MPATGQTINHWAGDSAVITVPVRDGLGAAVDLTGATARWWMGKNVKALGADVYVKKTTDPGDGGGITIQQASPTDVGVLIITIDAGDTEGLRPKIYYHEVELVIGDSVSTVTTGNFVINGTMIPDEL
jgi:hypothetical protein